MQNRSRWWLAAAILLAWLPVIVPAAKSAVWQWSTTASSNASADPSINYREGQPPSSINDSGRAMMAALAGYRDDISGLLTTTGTSTAYTVTTNQGLCVSPSTTPQDGQQLAVTVNTTNGLSPTLQADSCSAYPIQSSAGTGVPAASLIQGSPYTLRFSVANGAWMLRDFYGSALTVPLGGMIAYTGTTSPNSNFVIPVAQCLSTATYAAYWALLGSPASGNCPGGQFQIIDLRGNVPAGLDQMGGASARGNLTNSSTGCGTTMNTVGAQCANGSQSRTLIASNLPSSIPYTDPGHTHGTTDPGHSHGMTNIDQVVGLSENHSGSFTFQGSGSFTQEVVINGFTINNATTGLSINAASTGITINPSGGTAHPVVQPTVGVTYLLRVL